MSLLILFIYLIVAEKNEPVVSQNCDGDFDFRCNDGRCIYSGFRCDGENDCNDMTDENNCDLPQECGGRHTGMSGTIMTPGYPRRYPHSSRCTWIIEGPTQSTVHLNFTTFHLENPNHEGYCYDWLQIIDSKRVTLTEILENGAICGENKIDFYESSGNYLWLQFVSDSTERRPGFVIHYEIVPVSTITSPAIVTTTTGAGITQKSSSNEFMSETVKTSTQHTTSDSAGLHSDLVSVSLVLTSAMVTTMTQSGISQKGTSQVNSIEHISETMRSLTEHSTGDSNRTSSYSGDL